MSQLKDGWYNLPCGLCVRIEQGRPMKVATFPDFDKRVSREIEQLTGIKTRVREWNAANASAFAKVG